MGLAAPSRRRARLAARARSRVFSTNARRLILFCFQLFSGERRCLYANTETAHTLEGAIEKQRKKRGGRKGKVPDLRNKSGISAAVRKAFGLLGCGAWRDERRRRRPAGLTGCGSAERGAVLAATSILWAAPAAVARGAPLVFWLLACSSSDGYV